MSVSLSTLINDLSGATHGTTISKITNLYGLFNRAAGAVIRDVDLMETKRIVTLGQVFSSIYNYSSPTDLKGNRVIDLRPQAGREGDLWLQHFNQWFDRKKYLANQNQFTIQINTGVKAIRIDAPFLSAPVVQANPSSTTGWAVGGTASNLTIDTIFQVAGVGALQFDLTTGTGYIESSSLPQVDLTKQLSIAQEFFWIYMPAVATSVTLRWGSDGSNYYSGTATAQQDGTAFQAGWNLITIPWSSAIKTGAPTITAYDYVRVSLIAPSAMVGVKFCYLTSIIGSYLEAEYYSKYMFRNGANVFQETVSEADDAGATYINIDTESYDIFFNKLMFLISQQLQGDTAKDDVLYFGKEYLSSIMRYKNLYPSEVQFTQEPYYQQSSGADYNGLIPGTS